MPIRLPPAEIPPDKPDSNRPELPRPEFERGQPDCASHSGWEALVALARLLGRQAAQEHLRSQGG